jgi:spore germination cell wall hydrolase CwlJ-like protein
MIPVLLAGAMALAPALPAMRPASAAPAAQPSAAREIECLALTMYFEARSEGDAGKIAVGHVVLNRIDDARFPGTACAVVKQGDGKRGCQFSWWCDGLSDRPRDRQALRESLSLAHAIYKGCVPDPTLGALWFHTTRVKPAWSKTSGPGRRIGRHVFYRGAPGVETAAATDVRWSKSEKVPPAECAPPPKPAHNLLAASRS